MQYHGASSTANKRAGEFQTTVNERPPHPPPSVITGHKLNTYYSLWQSIRATIPHYQQILINKLVTITPNLP